MSKFFELDQSLLDFLQSRLSQKKQLCIATAGGKGSNYVASCWGNCSGECTGKSGSNGCYGNCSGECTGKSGSSGCYGNCSGECTGKYGG